MIIRLKKFRRVVPGNALVENIAFEVDTTGNKDIFSQRFIIEQILNHQESDPALNNKWINPDKLNVSKIPRQFIRLHDLSLQPYMRLSNVDLQTYLNNSEANEFYTSSIILSTNDEFNEYFKVYNDHFYLNSNKTRNSLLILPYHSFELIDSFDNFAETSDEYIILPAFRRYTERRYNNGERVAVDFSYVIHKEDLSKPVLTVNAPEDLMPLAIGKKGCNIKSTIDQLGKISNSKVSRINLIPNKAINDLYKDIMDI